MKRLARPIWLFCAIAATLFFMGAVGVYTYYYFDEAFGPRVVCLMYHRFVTSDQFAQCRGNDRYYAIPKETFEKHLQYLSNHGYHTLSTRECLDFLKGKREVPANSVYLTIDDGYVSTLMLAQPLLKKYGMRATLFATADPNAEVFHHGMPAQPRMTDQELLKLDPGVIEVQAHGLTHRPLTHLKDSELLTELTLSRDRLEHVVRHPVRCMAVPGNDYDDRVLAFARRAGYDAVFTSDPGSLDIGDDAIGLPRVNVAGYFDAKGLASLLDPSSMARRRFIRLAGLAPRQILGSGLGGRISSWTMGLFAGTPSWANYLLVGIGMTTFLWCLPVIWTRGMGRLARFAGRR